MSCDCAKHKIAAPANMSLAGPKPVPDRPSFRAQNLADSGDPDFAIKYNAAPRGRRLVIENACIVTLDPAVGDFLEADILIENDRIIAIGPDLRADAMRVAGRGKIVFPGFVDSHRHCWQNVMRRFAPNILWREYRASSNDFANIYRPEDVYLGGLVSALGALDAGVTTMLDWSHISNTPDHSDAAIAALRASGMRAVYAFGQARSGVETSQYPQDIRRIRAEQISGEDGLVTLCLAADIDRYRHWHLARELGLRISAHAARHPQLLHEIHDKGLMGSDVTYIHCTAIDDLAWRYIRDSGASISLAAMSVAQLGVAGGYPPIQKALDLGIRPSLSVDVEVALPGDFFSQMRVFLNLQRSAANDRRMSGDAQAPAVLGVRDVLEFATIEGARALGLFDRIGTLTPGKKADMVILDAEDFNTMPLNNAIGTIVSGADARNVETVLVDGNIRKWHRRLVGVDKAALSAKLVATRDRLVERSGYSLDPLGLGIS